MTTRSELQALLEAGSDYESIGARLGIAPGLVYMIANGVPADNSDAGHRELRRATDRAPAVGQPAAGQPDGPLGGRGLDQTTRRADLSRDDG